MTVDNAQTDGTVDCVFCRIVRGEAPATIVTKTGDCTLIKPMNPVTPGHVLVIPNRHVKDAIEDPALTGEVMEVAAHFAKHPEYHARPKEGFNLITSVGVAATQSIYHLHVHVVPRRPDDGLLLPWGSNEAHVREHMKNAYLFYSGAQ